MLSRMARQVHRYRCRVLLQVIFQAWLAHCEGERRILHSWALWWQRRLRQCLQRWQQYTCSANQFRARAVRVHASKLKRLFKVSASVIPYLPLIEECLHW
jgi:hypothetical protein